MANSISHASLPFPVKNARYTVLVPYLDADGDPTDPTTPDSEVSQDGGAFADAAEEVTTITGTNGLGYITLTSTEMNNSAVGLAFKVASGPKATLMTLYPRLLPIIESGTAQAGAVGTITLASAESAVDDYYVGCIVRTTGGTGGGGANNQARVITDYVGSTKVASVIPNWETTPDSTTTYDVLLTENAYCLLSDLRALSADGQSLTDLKDFADAGYDPATNKVQGVVLVDTLTTYTGNTVQTGDSFARLGAPAGASVSADIAVIEGQTDDIGAAGAGLTAVAIGVGGIATTSFAAGAINAAAIAADAIGASEIAAGAIDAATFAAGAIDAAAIANGAIDAATFAAGAIDAAAIATGAIDADALAADAVTEIWDKAIAELAQAAPAATPTVLNAIAMLYMIARNAVTVTSTSKTFSNDAGTVVFKKALSDDGTTYTEAEAASGP